MPLETVRDVLGWCTLINLALLLYWWAWLIFAHDWVYNFHTRWFKISTEQFDAIHYGLMGWFKLTFIVFNLVPYLALRIVG